MQLPDPVYLASQKMPDREGREQVGGSEQQRRQHKDDDEGDEKGSEGMGSFRRSSSGKGLRLGS